MKESYKEMTRKRSKMVNGKLGGGTIIEYKKKWPSLGVTKMKGVMYLLIIAFIP